MTQERKPLTWAQRMSGWEKALEWEDWGRANGLEVHPHWVGGPMPLLQRRVGHHIMTAGFSGGIGTRLRAFYLDPAQRGFMIRPVGLVSEMLRLLFHREPESTGDKRFDVAFRASPRDGRSALSHLLEDERVRELMMALRSVRLVAAVPNRFLLGHGAGATEDLMGLDIWVTHVASAEVLDSLFELAERVLVIVDGRRGGDLDEVEWEIHRLRARGGKLREAHLELWEGDRVRREAAARLGELADRRAVPALTEALHDEDDAVRVGAIEALGRLLDRDAVGPLATLLGDRTRSGGVQVSERAARVLRLLDARDLVDGFYRAVQGHPEDLQRHVGPFRREVSAALVDVMTGADLAAVEAAGRALALLGSMEILRDLKSLQDRSGWDRTREACRRTIAELESRASLPRPARPGGTDPNTLPRPAGETTSDPSRLPRAAEASDEHQPEEDEG